MTMGKRKGRPPITDKVPVEKILKAVEIEGSARGAARRLGTTHRTVLKVMRENGVVPNPPHYWTLVRSSKPGKKYSKFAQWLYDQPSDAQLPRSIAKLAKLSGCDRNSVSCFMYRRRTLIKDKLLQLPDLVGVGALMKATNGELINTRSFVDYAFEMDHYDLSVTLIAETDKYAQIPFEIDDLGEFIANVQKLSTSQEVVLRSRVRTSKRAKHGRSRQRPQTGSPS